jgi:CO/xanthine dehydrogenase FAD-binding subunit
MKPPRFEYAVADSVEEAVELLGQHGSDAKVLAGGQSLMPLLNLRLARPSLLVDVNPIRELETIDASAGLTIGALARQADALVSPDVRVRAPLLAEALRHVGHPAIRNRGTIGGSIAHADPAGEPLAVLVALDGEIVATGPRGERTIPASSFCLGPFSTALEPGELLTAVRAPAQDGRRFGFVEIARRRGDFAIAGAAVVLEPARIALFGVAGTPIRAVSAEEALAGGASATEAAALAASSLEPSSDVHASAEYRRRVAAVVVRRALEQAGARAG